ncbi:MULTISPECIES: GNAT family N-acetyltransferase [unclassified Sphingobacterium]|uniref:GNAT family N-acetyltransferase n=1 Tax=unclassified Sphingobacterium TaxID=2609468 RepID=UPI0025EF32A8|nr:MULTISPECIES: GNAT family N-acetyltransferase [unclassified Sphingobacterium]
MNKDLIIKRVSEQDVPELITYVSDARKLLFPMLDHHKMPYDLQHFAQTYIHARIGTFLEARDQSGNLIAVIGMLAYDQRFSFLRLEQENTVEVVRLYVNPKGRRKGVATALFQELVEVAKAQAISTLYLHTHPFLTGAYEFWLQCGFKTLIRKDHSGFETIHMKCEL